VSSILTIRPILNNNYNYINNMNMQVRCYDCGQLVSQGEAIKQKSRGGYGGGASRGKDWNVGGGAWSGEGRDYWLCIPCDKIRVANRRFWKWVVLIIGLILIFASAILKMIGRGIIRLDTGTPPRRS
jgi:hypothetical protein